jgi:hypothetical protein
LAICHQLDSAGQTILQLLNNEHDQTATNYLVAIKLIRKWLFPYQFTSSRTGDVIVLTPEGRQFNRLRRCFGWLRFAKQFTPALRHFDEWHSRNLRNHIEG